MFKENDGSLTFTEHHKKTTNLTEFTVLTLKYTPFLTKLLFLSEAGLWANIKSQRKTIEWTTGTGSTSTAGPEAVTMVFKT